ncbi:hypothetical protein [Chenggangzhangella methanolivorans]|uniref:Uncharacterized protein n=1 Tax=Chenggangzhangella methanolivorans TaxID=1437009 RepID=A0A9E6RAB3_9HYPH|nr:hypothetical protein [Chenggangzhangella methanolivorans]QZO01103.1 hypothetical protein K6K41_05885 [Chenggangzhangella methanolivorans]
MIDQEKKSPPHPFSSDKVAARLDKTTEAAKEIVDRNRAAEDAKTARLRAARKARDAAKAK